MGAAQELYTVAEVAAILRSTPEVIRCKLRDGTIYGSKPLGREWRIRVEEVERLKGRLFEGSS